MKSRHQRELAQQILSREVGYVRKPHADRLRVALIFPNTYFVGMSNLGFQTMYRLFNDQPDIVCERAFLPPKQELAALRESRHAHRHARIADAARRLRRDRVLGVVRMGLHQRPHHAAAGRRAGARRGSRLQRSAGRDRRRRDVRQSRAAGAVRRRDRRRRRRSARAGAARRVRHLVAERAAEAAGPGARLLHPVVLRRRVRRRRHDRAIRAARRHRRAAGRAQGGAQDHRRGRSAVDHDLHARHRVRLALPRRGRARLRQPVPLLLGRLQLPAGPRVPDGAHPRPGAGGPPVLVARRPGVDRALRSPRHRAHPAQPEGHGLFDQPGVAAPGRPDADDRVAAQGERRAHADHRAGDRIGSAAPRHQQDDHQRRDPRSRRADLLEPASRA